MARRRQEGETGSAASDADERPRAEIGALRGILPYLAPYKAAIAGALMALTVAASAVLIMGVGLRSLVDQGFRSGDTGLLDDALIGLLVVITVLTAATYARFFLVSWIGERIVADIRRDVFNKVIGLSPGFFEITRVGEVLSRLTADATLLKTSQTRWAITVGRFWRR